MNTMNKTLLAAALVATSGLAWAPRAHADLISFGLQETGYNGNAIDTVDTGSGNLVYGGSFGTFSINDLTATDTVGGSLPELLGSTSNNTSTTTAGTLTIWITAQDLTQPLGNSAIINSLTSNLLPKGWTVTETTYYSAANALYGGTSEASHEFSAIGTDVIGSVADFVSPYSVTEEYVLTATGKGEALSTINMNVPEPSSLALFGAALFGLCLIGRASRRRLSA